MKNLEDKKVLVYDYGNYFEVAMRLSRDYGAVYYFNPVEKNGFTEQNPLAIGLNVPEVIKVREWASVIDEIDLVFFPDSMEPHLQNFFRSIGKLVFGSVFACELEHNRVLLKETLRDLGLPVGLYSTAKGLDQLEELLKNSTGGYVKSSLRGEMETWRHKKWELSEREIKRLRVEMGLYENEETYILEHPIEAISEIGYDGFCIDGKYPEVSLCGIEVKDCAYISRFIHYNRLPEQLKLINEGFSDIFNKMGYRAQYSTEVIISKDKRGFLIDNTCRCGAPPTSIMLEAYTNYSEIVWDVANGRMPKIEFEYQWGVELVIKSDIAEHQESPIIVPEEYKKFVKIKNLAIDKNGTWYHVPQGVKMLKEIGSVIGLGNSLDQAIKMAKKIADSIEGFDTYVKTEALDSARESLDELKKAGISFI
jgi:hypothetical protein